MRAHFLQSSVCALARAEEEAAPHVQPEGGAAGVVSQSSVLWQRAGYGFVTSAYKGSSISCMLSEIREPL